MLKLSILSAAGKSIFYGRGNFAAAAQTVLTRLLALGINASTSIIGARLLRAEGRGEMAAIIMWASLLTGLLTLGLPSSLVFNIRRTPDRASSTVTAGLFIALILAFIAAVVGYFLVPTWLRHYSDADILYARWFLLSSPIPIVNIILRAAMEAEGKFTQSNTMAWSGPFLTLLGLIGLGVTHQLTPVTGGLAYVLGSVPAMIWLLVEVWRDYAPTLRGIKRASSHLLKYGMRAWGIDLLSALAGQADQLLIVRFLDAELMGVYVVAANFARMLSVIQTSATTILLPRVAARDLSEVISLTGKTLRITTVCTFIGAILASLTGSALLRLIYGVEYADKGTVVFRVLLCEVVLSGATEVLAQAFMAVGRPGVVSVIQGAGVGVGVSLMPLLIERFGITGAGIALLTSTSIRFVLTLLCFRPILKTSPPNLMMSRHDWNFAANRITGFVAASEAMAE